MNLCIHGYPIENCPHCIKSAGIKPPIQLVKPFPREISMPTIYEEKLLNSVNFNQSPLFKPSNSRIHEIKPIIRKYKLDPFQDRDTNLLFENRKKDLQEKYKINSESEFLTKSEQLINLKEKFV